jgi:hypothetical protein
VADKKSKEYPNQWPDGSWHSVSWSAHRAAMRALPVGNVPGLGAAALGHAPAPVKGVDRPLSAPEPTPVAGAAAPPAGTPAAGGSAQIVPDAEYLAEAAFKAFERTTQINSLTDEGKNDRSDTAEAIRRLQQDAIQGRQAIREGANKEGLFYSGQLTKRQGDYDTAVTRTTGDLSTQLQHREDARTAGIQAIQQGAPLENAIALASAGTRQVGRDTSAADLNALIPNPGVPAAQAVPTVKLPGAAAPAADKAQPRVVPGNGGVWHVYPDGHKVWVPKRK